MVERKHFCTGLSKLASEGGARSVCSVDTFGIARIFLFHYFSLWEMPQAKNITFQKWGRKFPGPWHCRDTPYDSKNRQSKKSPQGLEHSKVKSATWKVYGRDLGPHSDPKGAGHRSFNHILAQVSTESNSAAKCRDEKESFSRIVVLTLRWASELPGEVLNCPMCRPKFIPIKSEFLGVVPGHPYFIKLPRGF